MKTTAYLLAILTLAGCSLGADPAEDESGLWEQSFEEKDDGKADGAGCSGVRIPDQSGFGRRIALTFDDGPNAVTTPQVMAILERYGAPATFFVNGSRFTEATRPVAAEIVANPLFTLGNHTWSHPDMKTLSAESAAREIDRTGEALASVGAAPSFFRFPFGSSSCATAQMVRDRGYHVTGWHIDSADWCFAAGGGYCRESTFRYVTDSMRGDITAWVLSQARSTDGGVLLFHDIHANTVAHLEGILEALVADGFTFTGLDDIDVFPLLNGVAPAPGGFIGDPCERDEECRFAGGFCLPADEIAGGYCTATCTSSCPDRAGYPTTRCVDAPDLDGASSRLCTIGCGAESSCRDPLSCQSLPSPSGLDRQVCWR